MGLFGDLDANEVPNDPFFVEQGTYHAVLSEASQVVKSNDETKKGISFKWVIDDESDYAGKSVSDWLAIFPDIDASEITADVRTAMSRTKQRLFQMGLDEDQMSTLLDDDNLENLVGMEADLQVTNSADKNDPDKIYTNVRKVILD